MKLKRILLNFWRFTAAVLLVFGRSIVSKMTDNAYFPTPDPALSILTTALDDMETKAALAKDGSKLAKSNLKTSKDAVITILRQLAWYVEKTANGVENILISCGFDLSKEPVPSQRDDFFALLGTSSGNVLIGCVAFPKAGAYLWMRSPADSIPVLDKDWLIAGLSTQRKKLLTDIPVDQYLWFRYRAVTPTGLTAWFDPIRLYVQ